MVWFDGVENVYIVISLLFNLMRFVLNVGMWLYVYVIGIGKVLLSMLGDDDV